MWQIEQAGSIWMTPEWGALYQSYTPTEIARESSKIGVSACIAIECGVTEAENRTLEEMTGSSELIKAFVSHVDFESPTLDSELDYWQRNPKVRGVRMRFEGHPDRDILKRPSILAGLEKVAERGLI